MSAQTGWLSKYTTSLEESLGCLICSGSPRNGRAAASEMAPPKEKGLPARSHFTTRAKSNSFRKQGSIKLQRGVSPIDLPVAANSGSSANLLSPRTGSVLSAASTPTAGSGGGSLSPASNTAEEREKQKQSKKNNGENNKDGATKEPKANKVFTRSLSMQEKEYQKDKFKQALDLTKLM
eukprot:Tamp_25375.p1 GENE.Tamp_25375~~Tamp_25375.p1  ORF type:complete len:206 (+),score=26.97 Tamp_25375:84-620(+)